MKQKNHLRKGLIEDLKFKQSLVDPCLFCRGQVILVICVDDCLIFTPKKSEADNLIQELEDEFAIEDEGDVSGYLGTNITRPTNGAIKMNQPALTKRIVDSLGLKDQRMHDVPAEPNARLTKDEDGPERKDQFHYRSLIGQLNYLTASTRPEIQFATHWLSCLSAHGHK